jgi:tRNA pseudouridine55 synthase
VVARIRRVLDGAKVGHAGTLDPDATGVLVICVGKATKISAFLMEGVKEYEGTGRLGVTTDTQDATGEVLRERPVDVSPEQLRAAAAAMTGVVEQVPPMFSAVKVGGQRLYRLARKGVEVERAARTVRVDAFEITSADLPTFRFELRCSKGTYVRTLLHDLGERLGCGGHLEMLVRRRQGPFTLERAVPWETLRTPEAAAALRRAAVSPAEALEFLPARAMPPGAVPRKVGDVLPPTTSDQEPGALCRLVVPSGAVRAVGRVTEAGVRILYLVPVGAYGRGRRP